jgi:hypothetical protein
MAFVLADRVKETTTTTGTGTVTLAGASTGFSLLPSLATQTPRITPLQDKPETSGKLGSVHTHRPVQRLQEPQ